MPALVRHRLWRLGAVLALAALVVVPACSKRRSLPLVVNQPPVVTLTQAPAASNQPYFYAYEIFWTGYDPDGRVDHYLYCVDPPTQAGSDTPWVYTQENRHTFLFSSKDADSLGTPTNPGGFHVFVIVAVDDQGARSPVVAQAFFSYTVAPTVRFVQPRCNSVFPPFVPPTTTITFTGDDPDGQTSRTPVKYKYKLFSLDNQDFDFLTLLLRPDSLRHYYAKQNWAGWDSVAGDTARVTLTHLQPGGTKYVLAVISFDEAGAYSPVFSLDTNMLYFTCQYEAINGPAITIWNDYFSFAQSGLPGTCSFCDDPTTFVHLEVPYGKPISFNWHAVAHTGNFVRSYRWCMDIDRLDDETERSSQTDVRHWSTWEQQLTTAVVGPFVGGTATTPDEHHFYVESEDDNGIQSLVSVDFVAVKPSYSRPLLVVNDTRFAVDFVRLSKPDSILTPGGPWPTAAELDTFMFARGGVRWRYVIPYGTLSPPGVLLGYDYDTLGTRGLASLPLTTLARYRAVVWMCDPALAYQDTAYEPNDSRQPITMLHWMTGAGRTNTLSIYSAMGGRLWLCGGGAALNSLMSRNVFSNDRSGYPVFSNALGELVPGRVMYSVAHWQSEISTGKTYRAVINPALAPTWPGAPDFSTLPAELIEREGGDTPDPVPPMRNIYSFASTYDAEVLDLPNTIVDLPDSTSALDTLYTTGEFPGGDVVMTLYHGQDNGPVVFSGLPPWFFHHDECVALTDFVLQSVFQLTRAPLPRDPHLGTLPVAPATLGRHVQPARRASRAAVTRAWR